MGKTRRYRTRNERIEEGKTEIGGRNIAEKADEMV